MSHKFAVRVHYEDTDMGAIVYHANFVKFVERARSDWMRCMGADQGRMLEEERQVLVVRRIEADYFAPGRFEDELEVHTKAAEISGARLVLDQRVARGEEVLFAARVTVVCMDMGGRPRRLPETFARQIAATMDG